MTDNELKLRLTNLTAAVALSRAEPAVPKPKPARTCDLCSQSGETVRLHPFMALPCLKAYVCDTCLDKGKVDRAKLIKEEGA